MEVFLGFVGGLIALMVAAAVVHRRRSSGGTEHAADVRRSQGRAEAEGFSNEVYREH